MQIDNNDPETMLWERLNRIDESLKRIEKILSNECTISEEPALKQKPRLTIAEAVLEDINKILGTKFRPVQANMKFLYARFDEGATSKEILDVARFKKNQWGDNPDMRTYLRIETLYNATKFQSYLAEVDQAKKLESKYAELL